MESEGLSQQQKDGFIAFALSAYVVAREGPGAKMCGWCLNREVDVE